MTDPWQAITLEELDKHKDVETDNAWISIKGIVYNVSGYVSKHPGGVEKILKYVGQDATDIFNMVHSYVDAEAILQGCQVGILKGHPEAPKRGILSKLKDRKCCCFGGLYKSPTTYFKQDSIVGTYVVEFRRNSQESDWTIGIKDKVTLQVLKFIDKKKAWFTTCELPEPLKNDQLTIDFIHNYQHVLITLRKPIPTTIWANQSRTLKESGRFVRLHIDYSKFDAFLLYKKCLTNNVLMFAVQVSSSARIGVPLGFHVKLYVGDVSKPYTPVCPLVLEPQKAPPKTAKAKIRSRTSAETILYFLIKIYPNGSLTQNLDQLSIDDGREIPTLQVGTPHGYFDSQFLHEFSMLLLICGGTGLTPMIRMIQDFIDLNYKMGNRQVLLIYFCQTEHDIVWKQLFYDLDGKAQWFHYRPVLTQPTHGQHAWQGLSGRITTELVYSALAGARKTKGVKKACICGPPGFNVAAVEALTGIVLVENIFVFSS